MNIEELKFLLKKNHVPAHYYNLDGIGEDDDKICLVHKAEKWHVYYSERGVKFREKMFSTEAEACEEVYNRLVN